MYPENLPGNDSLPRVAPPAPLCPLIATFTSCHHFGQFCVDFAALKTEYDFFHFAAYFLALRQSNYVATAATNGRGKLAPLEPLNMQGQNRKLAKSTQH